MNLTIRAVSIGLVAMTLTACSGLAPRATVPQRGRETGRAFLIAGQTEVKGYGLYSYFLLGAPPTEATRDQYLDMIAAYLCIPDIRSLEGSIERWELNITYLPLSASPPLELSKNHPPSQCEGAVNLPFAQWVLDHYDYARARVLLRAVPEGGTHRNGPYIVSSLVPLSMTSTLSPPYLYQDLSYVPSPPPRLVRLWVNEFLDQTAQARFGEARQVRQLALKLRQAIAVIAQGLPDVLEALDRWIVWINPT